MVKTILPVTPLVGQFVRLKCGDPFELSNNNIFGSYLIKVLEKKYYRDVTVHPDKYCDQLQVIVGREYFERDGFGWSRNSIQDFNKHVANIFYEVFNTSMDFYLSSNPDATFLDAHNNFVDSFGLDIVIFNYERAKKSYYRHRKAQRIDNQHKKIIGQVVPRHFKVA